VIFGPARRPGVPALTVRSGRCRARRSPVRRCQCPRRHQRPRRRAPDRAHTNSPPRPGPGSFPARTVAAPPTNARNSASGYMTILDRFQATERPRTPVMASSDGRARTGGGVGNGRSVVPGSGTPEQLGSHLPILASTSCCGPAHKYGYRPGRKLAPGRPVPAPAGVYTIAINRPGWRRDRAWQGTVKGSHRDGY
jgi:hypothetical protein